MDPVYRNCISLCVLDWSMNLSTISYTHFHFTYFSFGISNIWYILLLRNGMMNFRDIESTRTFFIIFSISFLNFYILLCDTIQKIWLSQFKSKHWQTWQKQMHAYKNGTKCEIEIRSRRFNIQTSRQNEKKWSTQWSQMVSRDNAIIKIINMQLLLQNHTTSTTKTQCTMKWMNEREQEKIVEHWVKE